MADRYVVGIEVNGKTAGNKAQKDINQISEEMGYTPIKYKVLGGRIAQFMLKQVFQKQLEKIPAYSTLLLQYPLAGNLEPKVLEYLEKRPDLRMVLIIHDVDILRNNDNIATQNFEKQLMHRANKIIVHNYEMKRGLLERVQDIDSDNLVELELFDYICNLPDCSCEPRLDKSAIVIAGNLNKNKSGYIYKLAKSTNNLNFHLYGINYSESEGNNVIYHGAFQPEDLPQKLNKGFGLVWDGEETTECSGHFGEYLKYNNPHKLSLYIAAGLPVIVWSKAAVRKLVETNKIGFAIDSITDLENIIKNLSNEEYRVMTQNAMRLGEKVRKGYFTKRVLSALEEDHK